MATIIEKLEIKEPRFHKKYQYLFEKYARKWGGSEEERLDRAKTFRNNYELYMYAFFLGVRQKSKVPFSNRSHDTSNQNVMNIKSWKPFELQKHLIACVIAEAGIPLREYDTMDEKAIDAKSTQLRGIVEEYANGGFSIIHEQFNEDKDFFTEMFAFSKFVFGD